MSSDPIIAQINLAMQTMYTAAPSEVKANATHFLEQFQKSEEAWETTVAILLTPWDPSDLQLRLFAAQTLRSKVTYDLSQLPSVNWPVFKDSLLSLLAKHNDSPRRLIRTQLSLALSHLALQFFDWRDPMSEIIDTLSNPDMIPSLLEFLRVLPEELSDAQKTCLSDQEFNDRTQNLITSNVERVLLTLRNLVLAPAPSSLHPQLLDCLNSWIKECPIESILQVEPLTSLIFQSLTNDDTFEKAVDCLCTILRETRDIDNHAIIDALYQQLLQLNLFIMEHQDKREDPDTVDSLTRLYVEAGELWHVLIAKNPSHFKPLVDIILNACRYREDLDVVKYTFYFWYLLKLLLTLPRYAEQRAVLAPSFADLIEIITSLLKYPTDAQDNDLFHGDHEEEDKFKEFRYELGDVLKDCCAVVGAPKALAIPFAQIQAIVGQAHSKPSWQSLEAPLFALRAMAKEVPSTEQTILPTIFLVLVQLPEHPKVRYATTLVLGRYTEWTSKNEQFLEPQLQYILKGFEASAGEAPSNKSETVIATSRALMYFCQDCLQHLTKYLEQLYSLYGQIKDQLDHESHLELADGLAHVIGEGNPEFLYKTAEMFITPTVNALNEACASKSIDEQAIANNVSVLKVFMAVLKAKKFDDSGYPVASLFIDTVWPLIGHLLNTYQASFKVSESVLNLLKSSIQLFSTYLNGILGDMAQLLVLGYQNLRFGCYLWVSGVLVREYGDEYTSADIKNLVYEFGTMQCLLFFEQGEAVVKDLPDVVDDFYRMASDMLMFFPHRLMADSQMLHQIFVTSILTLNVVNETDTLMGCLHFLIDLVLWGLPHPPISFFDENPDAVRLATQQWLVQDNHGGELLKVVLTGLIFRFTADVHQDANELMLKILQAVPEPQLLIQWIAQVTRLLPNYEETEVEKLLLVVSVLLPNKDQRRTRSSIKDFVTWYQRKNVSPRTEF